MSVSKKKINKIINAYIEGVQPRNADELPKGARFFDWETEGDVRDSLREMRDLLTGTKNTEK